MSQKLKQQRHLAKEDLRKVISLLVKHRTGKSANARAVNRLIKSWCDRIADIEFEEGESFSGAFELSLGEDGIYLGDILGGDLSCLKSSEAGRLTMGEYRKILKKMENENA